MRYFKGIIASLLLVTTSIYCSYSQNSIDIHFGPSIPASNFYLYSAGFEPNYKVTSSPKIGISLGLKYSYRFPEKKVGLFIGADFLFNKPNSEYVDSTINRLDALGHDVNKMHNYYNIPLSLGLTYQVPLNNKLKLDLDLGVTYNLLKVSDFSTKYRTDKTDWASSLGFKSGIGVLLASRVTLNLNYLLLGSHEVTVRISDDPDGSLTFSKELNVQFLTITAGVRF